MERFHKSPGTWLQGPSQHRAARAEKFSDLPREIGLSREIFLSKKYLDFRRQGKSITQSQVLALQKEMADRIKEGLENNRKESGADKNCSIGSMQVLWEMGPIFKISALLAANEAFEFYVLNDWLWAI